MSYGYISIFTKTSPFSYQHHKFETEVELVNKMSSDLNTNILLFKVTVGDDIFPFNSIAFFQGLITGANWNNLDPKAFITNLQQLTISESVLFEGRLEQNPKPTWIHLTY